MKRTTLLATCAAIALTLGASGAFADDHGRWNHHGHGHDRGHDRDRDHHRPAPRTIVSFNYGYTAYPGYFGGGYYAPQPVYYYPRYSHYHGPYCRHW